jgi:hypothetical protein
MDSINLEAQGASDATRAVAEALKECRKTGIRKITFSPGRYDFHPAQAGERYLYVSNNDEGLKRIAFDLREVNDLEIDGGGAEFVFHGYLCPFVVEKSSRITLRNFSIDFARTFHSEGRIVSVDAEGMELSFSENFPYEIRQGILVFTEGSKNLKEQTTVSSGEVLFPYSSLLEFDVKKRETAFMVKDFWAPAGLPARQLASGHIKLVYPGIEGTPGNILVFGAARRDCPGLVISDSKDVVLEGIQLLHCGGMGVIAQCSRNIYLNQLKVVPAFKRGRMVSITADATHFTNCSGKITLQDCRFENQKDDAVNIHGIYTGISRKLSEECLEVRWMHPQQFGLDFIVPGVELEFVRAHSLITYAALEVKSVLPINKEFVQVTFTQPLPMGLVEGDVLACIQDNHPEVLISGCRFRGNRARGILLGSRGKILIENNVFQTAGTAILLEGDGRFWFEQGGVRDLTIRGNTFDNCNYGIWGEGVIAVSSGIEEKERMKIRYHQNILIEKNIFRQFDSSPILSVYSVSHLIYRDNQEEQSTAYPAMRAPGPRFKMSDSDDIQIMR